MDTFFYCSKHEEKNLLFLAQKSDRLEYCNYVCLEITYESWFGLIPRYSVEILSVDCGERIIETVSVPFPKR